MAVSTTETFFIEDWVMFALLIPGIGVGASTSFRASRKEIFLVNFIRNISFSLCQICHSLESPVWPRFRCRRVSVRHCSEVIMS